MNDVNEMSAGGVAGFQVPIGIRQRKKHVDEVLRQNPDVDEGMMLSFFGGLGPSSSPEVERQLDSGAYSEVADQVRHHIVRELIRKKVREVVRKKSGSDEYVLYSPNKGKKGKPKAVGTFPTKSGAKRAELARFPPKDPEKLKRMRKSVDKLVKNPRKAAEKERQAKLRKPKPKSEGATVLPDGSGFFTATIGEAVDRRIDFMHRRVLSKIVTQSLVESLFREEKTESEWDEYISKLSKRALAGDSKFQKLQKVISKKTEGILGTAFDTIRKAVGKKIKLKNFGTKHDDQSGETYLAFSAAFEDGGSVEPIYVHVEGGVPKIEVSSNAKVGLTKVDPDDGKLFRAELVTVQERVLDSMDDLAKAISARDRYLEHLENDVDGYIAGLSPLQVSLLKQLLVKKYRKIA